MPPHPCRFPFPSRTLLGLAVAAGFCGLGPAPAARAQYSYGYDSFVYYPPAQTYWYSAGYSGVYTDQTTGAYLNGTQAPFRGVAPYAEPPVGQVGRGNGLTYYGRAGAVTTAPPPRVVVTRRRGLFGRVRGR